MRMGCQTGERALGNIGAGVGDMGESFLKDWSVAGGCDHRGPNDSASDEDVTGVCGAIEREQWPAAHRRSEGRRLSPPRADDDKNCERHRRRGNVGATCLDKSRLLVPSQATGVAAREVQTPPTRTMQAIACKPGARNIAHDPTRTPTPNGTSRSLWAVMVREIPKGRRRLVT